MKTKKSMNPFEKMDKEFSLIPLSKNEMINICGGERAPVVFNSDGRGDWSLIIFGQYFINTTGDGFNYMGSVD